MNKTVVYIVLLVSVLAMGCRSAYYSPVVHYKHYRMHAGYPADTLLQQWLRPYGDSVEKSMNERIGFAGIALELRKPESALGNFMVDAMLQMAREKFNLPVDVAIMNYGGIRLTEIPAGPITRGKIFELMPFDNLLVIQKVSGVVLQALLDHTASTGGWPVAGMQMQIKDKKAINVKIAGMPLDLEKEYLVASSSFVASGGDYAHMLKGLPQMANGYLLRDALIDHVRRTDKEGRTVTAKIENRVSYAE